MAPMRTAAIDLTPSDSDSDSNAGTDAGGEAATPTQRTQTRDTTLVARDSDHQLSSGDASNSDGNNDSDSDSDGYGDASSALAAAELGAERLCAGDTIEYYSMAFVFGDPRGHRVARVLSVMSAECEYPLRMDSQEMLPATQMIKRVMERQKKEQLAAGVAKWRKIRTFELVDGRVEGETRADRLNAALKNSVKEAIQSVKRPSAAQRAVQNTRTISSYFTKKETTTASSIVTMKSGSHDRDMQSSSRDAIEQKESRRRPRVELSPARERKRDRHRDSFSHERLDKRERKKHDHDRHREHQHHRDRERGDSVSSTPPRKRHRLALKERTSLGSASNHISDSGRPRAPTKYSAPVKRGSSTKAARGPHKPRVFPKHRVQVFIDHLEETKRNPRTSLNAYLALDDRQQYAIQTGTVDDENSISRDSSPHRGQARNSSASRHHTSNVGKSVWMQARLDSKPKRQTDAHSMERYISQRTSTRSSSQEQRRGHTSGPKKDDNKSSRHNSEQDTESRHKERRSRAGNEHSGGKGSGSDIKPLNFILESARNDRPSPRSNDDTRKKKSGHRRDEDERGPKQRSKKQETAPRSKTSQSLMNDWISRC